MIHKQKRVDASYRGTPLTYDSSYDADRAEQHDEVIHRVRQLQVRDGRLVVLRGGLAPSSMSAD
jgi:hypothetical protein